MFKYHRRDRHRARFVSLLEPMEGRQLLSIAPALMLGPGPVISGSSSTGIIHATKGVPFTANLGNFFTIVPTKTMQAQINWGDGTSSMGTLKPLGPTGVDVIRFEVDGTHTYSTAGTFTIKVIVSKPGPTPMSPVVLITTLTDEAIVTRGNVNLTGKITGHYTAAPTSIDVGALYLLDGTGTAGDMGPVAAKGSINLPGFISTGHATGTLTLSSLSASAVAGGTVTLKLTGPLEAGFGPVPSSMTYTVTGGTGAFAGATGGGTIGVKLNSDGTFALSIVSILPVV